LQATPPMRLLARRLLTWSTVTLTLASTLAGAALLAIEHNQLIADVARNTRLLARAGQVSVENALRDDQRFDVNELLTRLEIEQGEVDILVVLGEGTTPWLSSAAQSDHDALLQPVVAEAWATGEAQGEVHLDGRGPAWVQAFLLRPVDDEPTGMIVVARPLTQLQEDLEATATIIAVAMLSFIGLVSLALTIALQREVLGPLHAVIEATGRLGGDLVGPLILPRPRSAELDALGDALRHLQVELRQSREEAAEAAARRAEAERQLAEADRLVRVGQLAASLAHEIGSPLQVLVGRAMLLASASAAGSDARRQAEHIADQAARITRIVSRLQDVVRRREASSRPIDLAEPLGKVLWLLATEARTRGITVVQNIHGTPAERTIQADPDELQQLALNLILNAIQASRRGDEVLVEVTPDGSGVELCVLDHGHGMGVAVRERIFEPLFSTRVAAGGTGLGLTVVKGIADRQGASIELETAEGAGARFTLRFPRS